METMEQNTIIVINRCQIGLTASETDSWQIGRGRRKTRKTAMKAAESADGKTKSNKTVETGVKTNKSKRNKMQNSKKKRMKKNLNEDVKRQMETTGTKYIRPSGRNRIEGNGKVNECQIRIRKTPTKKDKTSTG
ncbi:hypothetical protein RUM43_003005 [Polyplax serrata]|uniref:Uncharacterized protein n=1 Tax=Polyplax serrata TaxID=468196 RepID=A0AAN8PDS5_POLSC